MKRGAGLIAAGFALTALSYGLARFAYGLFLPQITLDIGLGLAAAGWIGSASFGAYCVGVAAAFAGGRLGERFLVVLASLSATAGMALAAVAGGAWMLGLAMMLAGFGTGLTSPPLAAAVARVIPVARRSFANGAINAGTAAGIVLSGMLVLAFADGWRALYAAFAALGLLVTLWLWRSLPPRGPASRPLLRGFWTPGVLPLSISAMLAGAGSTAVWTFGATILRDAAGFSDGRMATAWVVLGVAGLAGGVTGLLTDRFGLAHIHRLALILMAGAMLALLGTSMAPHLGYLATALFGLGYIVSSGVFLLWGITLYRNAPDIGLGLPFLLLAAGQTIGASGIGAIYDAAGHRTAICVCIMLIAAAGPMVPRER